MGREGHACARLQQRVQVTPAGGQAQRVEVVGLELRILPGAPVHQRQAAQVSNNPTWTRPMAAVKGQASNMHACIDMHAAHRCSISAVSSVAAFFFSSANLGPLTRRYVFQASGAASLRFLRASASALFMA